MIKMSLLQSLNMLKKQLILLSPFPSSSDYIYSFPLSYRSTAQIPFHCLLPSFLLHLSPCPYQNRQNLLSLPTKNFQISNFPSFSRETNRNPKPQFPNSLIYFNGTRQTARKSTGGKALRNNQPRRQPGKHLFGHELNF